ncbi:MAG: YceI family protein [Rhodocyclaceae bacterium]|nr:YceI family protein [Rhodocyclaceae bacterium]
MRTPTLAVAALALLTAGPARADSYAIDPRHTFPSFEISHLGFSTQRGRFNKSAGSVKYDRAAQTLSAEIQIDAASVDTGLEKLEEHLRGPDFFNAESFPEIIYRANSARFDGERPVVLVGEFTLLGVTRPLNLTLNNFRCGIHPKLQREVCGADASAVIKRSDFGMTYGLPAIGDSVRLLIQVEAVKD